MRTIAHQGIIALHPRIAAHGGQHARRILLIIIHQTRHHGHGVWEIGIEKILNLLGGLQIIDTRLAIERHEQGTGEIATRIWQGNHHEALTRPNVQ